ncbi:MAG: C39 family peptidase, partial [bacterium]
PSTRAGLDTPWREPGVFHEKPILDVALKYTPASILASTTIDSLVRAIDENNPVVVWGSVTKGKDTSWQDEFGNSIKAIEGEHARVVVGYRGESNNPTHLLLLDPTYGKIQMTTSEFATDWALLDNKAVIIY